MSKKDEALEILRSFGLPKQQQNERSALTLLALANVGKNGSWRNAKQPLLRIWDIMQFMREKYKKDYAANSRETIRRQTIHQFEQARLVDRNPDDPTRPTNSGLNCYALTDAALNVIKTYNTRSFDKKVSEFINNFGKLKSVYKKERALNQVTLRLSNGEKYHLSPGKHNELQVVILNELGPRFAPGATILYIGDTAKKYILSDKVAFTSINIEINEHDKLPDIILYDKNKQWLYLIEAVTSHGPVGPKRHVELERMMENCPANRIYITAFPDMVLFRQYCVDIAWETEVWIADNPDHMIHFNGEKFLGPYKQD